MATTVTALRAEALFVSSLQASEEPAPEEVRAAVETSLRWRGTRGCAAAVAEEFGDHPDRAVVRMGWALSKVATVYRSVPTNPPAPADPPDRKGPVG